MIGQPLCMDTGVFRSKLIVLSSNGDIHHLRGSGVAGDRRGFPGLVVVVARNGGLSSSYILSSL